MYHSQQTNTAQHIKIFITLKHPSQTGHAVVWKWTVWIIEDSFDSCSSCELLFIFNVFVHIQSFSLHLSDLQHKPWTQSTSEEANVSFSSSVRYTVCLCLCRLWSISSSSSSSLGSFTLGPPAGWRRSSSERAFKSSSSRSASSWVWTAVAQRTWCSHRSDSSHLMTDIFHRQCTACLIVSFVVTVLIFIFFCLYLSIPWVCIHNFVD